MDVGFIYNMYIYIHGCMISCDDGEIPTRFLGNATAQVPKLAELLQDGEDESFGSSADFGFNITV